MVKLGQINTLAVIRISPLGCMLHGADLGEIPLVPGPQAASDTTRGLKAGEQVDVFVYRDTDLEIMATTAEPLVLADRVACLEVVALTDKGAYLHWGLRFDLFMPRSEQLGDMRVGRRCVVFAMLDVNSQRMIATARLHEHLSEYNQGRFTREQKVKVMVAQKTELGFRVVIDGSHLGMLYHNEIFSRLGIGDQLNAYVKGIRDDDKIDLVLQQTGRKKVGGVEEAILEHLNANGGESPITDKSPPEAIYKQFGVSKKVYKQALGALYKARRIQISKQLVTLNKE